MWAKVLKDQEKFDVALKKIVEAIQVYCSEVNIESKWLVEIQQWEKY